MVTLSVLPTVRAPFRRFVGFDVRTGISLPVVFGLGRVVLVLQANVTGSYQLVSVVFVAMAVLPWVVSTRSGRRKIGIVRPARWRWVLPAAIAGMTAFLAVCATAAAFWGVSPFRTRFAYIAGTYTSVPDSPSDADRLTYFIIYAVIGILFSSIGEELLYRGIAHESLATGLGNRGGAIVAHAAFNLAMTYVIFYGVLTLLSPAEECAFGG